MKLSFLPSKFRSLPGPLLLLLVTVCAYGWQVHRLGFYWDDWAFLYRYQRFGILGTIFYGDARQLGVLALMPGFLLAGDSPLLWHVYSLLLRWGVSLLFVWALGRMWPQQKAAILLAGMVFAVHPAFSQQAIAVVYSLQMVTYGIFLFSLGATIRAETGASRAWVWRALAWLGQLLHLFIVEYFVGLELIRPLVIYFCQPAASRRDRLKATLWRWLPYFLILLAYAVWRSGALSGGFQDYDYKTITALFRADPLAAIRETFEYGLRDLLVLFVQSWAETLSPSLVDFSQPSILLSLLVGGLTALGIFAALHQRPSDPEAGDRFLIQAATLGLVAAAVGFIPAWFVRRHIVEPGNFGDRLALASLLGASLLLVAVIRFFAGSGRRGLLLTAIFVGAAVGAQMRFINFYRWDWDRQLNTYWQVYWRAPGLAPETTLVGFNAISTTTVNYVGGFAFNKLYGTPVWYVNYPKTNIQDNLEAYRAGTWNYSDRGGGLDWPVSSSRHLAFDYDTASRCVRLLSPNDPTRADLPEAFQPALAFSSLALIQPDAAHAPPAHIFGPEPAPDWCYYFQKASLARQLGDWPLVIQLKEQADAQRLEPQMPDEWIPFIEAYARLGRLPEAEKLTLQAYKKMHKAQPALCGAWALIKRPAPVGLGCE